MGRQIPNSNPKNGPLGQVQGQVRSHPRILYLRHKKDSNGKDEWSWSNHEIYESLGLKYKIPNFLSWSASLINHSVFLFGGRSGKFFSNNLYKVQLRPDFVSRKNNLLSMTKSYSIEIEQALKNCDSELQKEELLREVQARLSILHTPGPSLGF